MTDAVKVISRAVTPSCSPRLFLDRSTLEPAVARIERAKSPETYTSSLGRDASDDHSDAHISGERYRCPVGKPDRFDQGVLLHGSFDSHQLHRDEGEPCSMLRGFRAGDRRAFFVSSDERARMSEIASKLCPLPRWWLTLSGHDSKACAIISIGAQAKLAPELRLSVTKGRVLTRG
jgi:hypothetical protein